ncbi:MAG TPA: cysteine--tRNA ligase, partial [Rhizobium sp.]|nr:cysteine--tRNA ligase [Rhizobium sp.]
WHIECSAMSKRYLGEVFDIHGGGLDLIFPHHENEIAQSCCANDTSVMANVWMHNGFVQVEGRKMSKSDGNFVTINELLDTDTFGGRKWPGEVLRLAMLMTHYREPIDFSVKRLEEAEANLESWLSLLDEHVFKHNENSLEAAFIASLEQDAELDLFFDLLKDDINTPLVLTRLRGIPLDIKAQQTDQKKRSLALSFLGMLNFLGLITPTSVRRWKAKGTIDPKLHAAITALVEMRLEMLKSKNFAEADKIRDDLLAKGIQLKDGKDKDTGERVTTWEVKR